MTAVLTLTPLTRASKVLRALRNVCSYFYLKDPRRKRDVPPWRLGADNVISASDAIHKPREHYHWCCFFPPGLLSGTQAPCITSSSREQQVFFEVEDWNLLSESSLEGAASGKFTQGRQWLNAEWKPLPFSFQHLWYQLKCVLEGLGTVLITAWTSTFSSGRKGSLFWIQWAGFLSQSYLLVIGILGLTALGSRVSQCHLLGCAVAAGSSLSDLSPFRCVSDVFGEVAQEAFKNGCSRERQWRCKAVSQNLLEKLTTPLASWSTHLAIKQEFTWEKSDFLC